jgi:hypothetical protein
MGFADDEILFQFAGFQINKLGADSTDQKINTTTLPF